MLEPQTQPRGCLRRTLVAVLATAALGAATARPAAALSYPVTNTSDSGAGSLRQAILDANAHSGADTITFALGASKTIKPTSPLPMITGQTDVNATSQPGYGGDPIVEIDGELTSGAGLNVAANGSVVRGLVINRFTGTGIIVSAANVTIKGNYIGTDVAGTLDLGNGGYGISIGSGTGGATIGGAGANDGNLISGNGIGGILITSGANDVISGNFIGTDVTGTAAIGNSGFGVRVTVGSHYIGWPVAGGGNLISGNAQGVSIEGTGGYVFGNIIGLNASGTAALPNTNYGVGIFTSNVTVGSTDPHGRNVISGNGGAGVSMAANSSGCLLVNNRIGTDINGTTALGNGGLGIDVLGTNNTVGGLAANEGNLVSGNGSVGVEIGPLGTGNQVLGNTIGLNAAGNAKLANDGGVRSYGAGNTIGSASAAGGNLISGNTHHGVVLSNDATGCTVVGNRIGTDASGAVALGNGSDGIAVYADGCTIGGSKAGEGNLVSGNALQGIEIDVAATGNAILGNIVGLNANGTAKLANAGGVRVSGPSNTVGGASAQSGNVISGNTSGGIALGAAATGSSVVGNRIGTNAAGTAALGNGSVAVTVYASNCAIGGSNPGEGNLISGNSFTAIDVDGSATGVVIAGNTIGLDAAGNAKVPNGGGVRLYGSGTTLGGASAGARNVISGNDDLGVYLSDKASGNFVMGNRIGTNAAGTAALGNGSGGIRIDGDGNTIGGALAGQGNLISGNLNGAIDISDVASGNQVLGNTIGLNATGTAALGNQGGIRIYGPDNVIGAPGAGNVISASQYSAIVIYGFYSQPKPTHNVIQSNKIGTAADGVTAFGNGQIGVWIEDGFDNTIGGEGPGEGNVIAKNGLYGVFLGSGTGNAVLGNSIFDNAFWGIDQEPYGVAINDPGDGDFGPDNGQNYPIITSAQVGGGQTEVSGVLDSRSSESYRIEVFSNPSCDPSGFGEGKTYLGGVDVMSNATGHATFDLIVPFQIADGYVSATATSASGDTSEFSPCALASGPNPGILQFSQSQFVGYENDGKVTITVTRSGGAAGGVSVDYATVTQGPSPATPGADYTPVSGTLTFGAGEVVKTFDVPLELDAIQEVQETIGLALSNPTGGATLGGQSASKVIIIDYSAALPTVHVSDAQVVEGNSGTKNMNFKITLSPNSKPVTVAYQTADGTAVAGVDYQAVNDQVIFNPGDGPKTISVPVFGDTDPEDNEVFYLVVTQVLDGTVTDGSGEGVILDDDSPSAQDGCVGGTTIAKPKLILTGLGDQPGNERFTFKGKLKFAAGVPAGMTPLDAVVRGAQLKIEDLGSGTTSIVDLSTATAPVPAGALSQPCTAGKSDGWTVNQTSTTYTYRNSSNRLAPACAAGSAHGLSRFKLMDRRSQVGRIAFLIKSRATSLAAPVGPVRATIILGADAADGLAGRCGTHTFDALSCTPSAGGARIVCQ